MFFAFSFGIYSQLPSSLFLPSEISSNLSPSCSRSEPFGIRNSSSRLMSITNVPAGKFMSFSVSAFSSMRRVTVMSRRSESISSGSSTPNSLPVFSNYPVLPARMPTNRNTEPIMRTFSEVI